MNLIKKNKKTILTAGMLLAFFCASLACSFSSFVSKQIVTTQQETAGLNSAHFELVLPSEERYPLARFEELLQTLSTDTGHENLVLFVHGMGDYPQKAFREKALGLIEAEYNAKVIMFHWPSWINFYTIPRANATESGKYLARFLEAFDEYHRAHPGSLPKNRILLLHSLGNAVLRGFLQDYDTGNLSPDLLSAIIMAAPEVGLRGHARWLGKADFSSQVYVMLNANDGVLEQVKRHLDQARLGMQLRHLDGSEEPLAKNATYIHTDRGAGWHRYYIQYRNEKLAAVFNMIANDNPVLLQSPYLEQVRAPNVYSVLD